MDLGVPSIELDVCENLLIDIILPSTTPSDKQSSAPNPVEKVGAVSLTVHKTSNDVPSQEESKDMLKKKSNAFAIVDMDIHFSRKEKRFVLLQQFCTTDQRIFTGDVSWVFVKKLTTGAFILSKNLDLDQVNMISVLTGKHSRITHWVMNCRF